MAEGPGTPSGKAREQLAHCSSALDQQTGSSGDQAPELHDATCGGRSHPPENARGRASFRLLTLGHSQMCPCFDWPVTEVGGQL